MRRILIGIGVVAAFLGVLAIAAFHFSPWPAVWLIRYEFDKGALAASGALSKHVSTDIESVFDLQYAPGGSDTMLDLFKPPKAGKPLPVIVWIHGGAYVYGRRDNVTNYLKIIASKGYATVAVGYSKAPSAQYPAPLVQVNAALEFLNSNAERLGLDAGNIILAGDSAGAQIAAQLAIVITAPDYARRIGIAPAITPPQLKGAILHCGPHGIEGIDLDGPFGGFLSTVLWSYFGTRDFANDSRLAEFSIIANMTEAFPPFFVSAGNADPLLPLSQALADRADALAVPVDALFFPSGYKPPLPHEYQFNLDIEAGRLALDRTIAFLAARTESPAN